MKILVIDGNNLAFKAYFGLQNSQQGLLETSTGIRTTAIFGIFNSLNTFAQKNDVDNFVLTWDVGKSKYRKDIFPHYKAGRVYKDLQDLFEELDDARDMIEKIGISQAVIKGVEADDSIGYLATKIKERGDTAIVLSDDKDMYQLYSKGIKIWRPVFDRFITMKDIVEEFGVGPKYIKYICAMLGQKKDNIPGLCDLDENGLMKLCGFGKAKAMKYMSLMLSGEVKKLSELLDIAEADNGNKWQDFFIRNRKQIMDSYKLMRIRTKNEQYAKWELDQLKEVETKLYQSQGVNYKTVAHYNTMLEFTKFSLVAILKKLGVKAKEKSNGSKEQKCSRDDGSKSSGKKGT